MANPMTMTTEEQSRSSTPASALIMALDTPADDVPGRST